MSAGAMKARNAAVKWDGRRRLHSWLARAVADQADALDPQQRRYLHLAGDMLIMGMVERAMRPGCKFDHLPVLIGAPGTGKSRLLQLLASKGYANTGLVLGDKDSLHALLDCWLYEISEIDTLPRGAASQLKALIATSVDYFRAPFEARAREYPRRCLLVATATEQQFLPDDTSLRRFLPIEVTRTIDIEWVTSVREQLFAEAAFRLRNREHYLPNLREQNDLIWPMQQRLLARCKRVQADKVAA